MADKKPTPGYSDRRGRATDGQQGVSFEGLAIDEIMTANPKTIDEKASLAETVEFMQKIEITALAVIVNAKEEARRLCPSARHLWPGQLGQYFPDLIGIDSWLYMNSKAKNRRYRPILSFIRTLL